MGTLKDLITSDVSHLFFNLDEFAETHRVEGKSIDVVVDGDKLEDLKDGANLGVAEADLLFFARSADVAHVPRKAPGSLINFDGRAYLIEEWIENMGVAQISLRQNRTV